MIEYADDNIILKINPRPETGGDYLFRTSLLAKLAGIKDIPAWAEMTYYFHYPVYLSCSTGTYSIGGGAERDLREMTIDEFLNFVPGQVMRVWADKVLELNQHILEFPPADDKKK